MVVHQKVFVDQDALNTPDTDTYTSEVTELNMPEFVKDFYDTEGPAGLPMKDQQAMMLDKQLRAIPDDPAFAFRRLTDTRGVSELQPGERADVSWITEESPDRMGDVVLASGMDDSLYQLNPVVTLNHYYTEPPVGKSLWRRKIREGSWHGVKAKTHYPTRPDKWPGKDWLPDYAYELVKADLLRGKSIGFFPLKIRTPSSQEISQRPEWRNVRYIIEKWLLAEYACCFLPVQPRAVVEQVSKSLSAPLPKSISQALQESVQKNIPFVTLHEIYKAVMDEIRTRAMEREMHNAMQLTWDKTIGRV